MRDRIFIMAKDGKRAPGTCDRGGAVLKADQVGDFSIRILLGDNDPEYFGSGEMEAPAFIDEASGKETIVKQDISEHSYQETELEAEIEVLDTEMDPQPLDGAGSGESLENRQLNEATFPFVESKNAEEAYKELFGEDPLPTDEVLEQQYQEIAGK